MFRGKRSTISCVVLAGLITGACSGTIHRKSLVNGEDILSVDARQRLVVTGEVNDKMSGTVKVACAEPSPDAIVARAEAFAARGSGPFGGQNVAAGLAASSNEAAGSIGLRTQPIQILRDGYYRLCEAYLNRAIEKQDYGDALDQIDGVIAVVMAIDALGGTVQAPSIVLQPGAVTANVSGDDAAAGTTPAAVVIENSTLEDGKLSDRQAMAIENITRAYINHVAVRNKLKLRGKSGHSF